MAVVTLGVFWQVTEHSFLDYDDQIYVTENKHVQAGLSRESVGWAFGTTLAGNWHPLTVLSHMLDCQLFGMESGWHHFTNVLFHTANVLLLFLVLKRMTGATWRSAFVAAMFALHPLHVESVAWVSERKDVLSTFCFILTIGAYVEYVKAGEGTSETGDGKSKDRGRDRFRVPAAISYVLSLFLFTLGLMSKPMVVTLPFVLLLLDYWPLGRLNPPEKSPKRAAVILEKIPFFALTLAGCIMTWLIQKQAGAMVLMKSVPLSVRLENVAVSYLRYITKTFWPTGLAAFYPFPKAWPAWLVAVAILLLLCVTAAALWQWKARPYIAVGWFWFLGTLVPVIGLVQVGLQSLADRYTYIPLIGLFIVVGWGAAELADGWPLKRKVLGVAGGLCVGICAVLTVIETAYWRDTATLFGRALAVTSDNAVAEYSYARALMIAGDNVGAVPHFQKAIRINPDYGEALSNLGLILVLRDQTDEGIALYRRGLKVLPKNLALHYNLGYALALQGHLDEAIAEYETALRLDASFPEGRRGLALALRKQGKSKEAVEHYRILLEQDPDDRNLQLELTEAQQEAAQAQPKTPQP